MPHQSLSIGTQLLKYCSMDVVFVAIDFEGIQAICRNLPHETCSRKQISQTGIAILDTRDLNKPPESVIVTRQFCTGPDWYCKTVSSKLIFGTSKIVTFESLSKDLLNLLRFVDPTTNALRPIVIIGHSLAPFNREGDLACFRKLIDQSSISPIIGYLDVREERVVLLPLIPLISDPLKPGEGIPTLQRVLEYLGIPFANLHVAANDAIFTLRASLMMAVREYQDNDRDFTVSEKNTISKLRGIALLPIQAPPGVKLQKNAFRNSVGGWTVKRYAARYEMYRRFREQNMKTAEQKAEIQEKRRLKKLNIRDETDEISSLVDGELLLGSEFDPESSSVEDEFLPDPESDQESLLLEKDRPEPKQEFVWVDYETLVKPAYLSNGLEDFSKSKFIRIRHKKKEKERARRYGFLDL